MINTQIRAFHPAQNFIGKRIFIYGAGLGGEIVGAVIQASNLRKDAAPIVTYLQSEADPKNLTILSIDDYMRQEQADDVIILALSNSIAIASKLKRSLKHAQILDATSYIDYTLASVRTGKEAGVVSSPKQVNCIKKLSKLLQSNFAQYFDPAQIEAEAQKTLSILTKEGNVLSDLPFARKISMLDPVTLAALGFLARISDGHILEIGAYQGGGTMAILDGLDGQQRELHTVEAGGSFILDPEQPPFDIHAAFQQNMTARNYEDRVTLHKHTVMREPDKDQVLRETLGPASVGLYIHDASARFKVIFDNFKTCLKSPCIVVIDDLMLDTYNQAPDDKSSTVWQGLATLFSEQNFQPLTMIEAGTLIGIYTPSIR